MAGYTKLFSTLIGSSVWMEDSDTRVVWITILALKDERHMVRVSIKGLARMAAVSVEKCEEAMKKFESPDPDSTNQAYEGRKLEKREGGWYVLNGPLYARMMSKEDRLEYQRIKAAEYRAAKKAADNAVREDRLPAHGNPLPGEAAYDAALKRGDTAEAERIEDSHAAQVDNLPHTS